MNTLFKKLSVNLIRRVEPIFKNHSGLYRISPHASFKLLVSDIDPDSDLFFGIIKEYKNNDGRYSVDYSCKPASAHSPNTGTSSATMEGLEIAIKNWFENLSYYARPSVLDDAILETYKEEFFNAFKITDDDADTNPFSYDQQLALTAFLEEIQTGIEIAKTPKNELLIEEIKSDAENLKQDLTRESKNEFMQRLSVLFAKARKGGLKLSEYLIKEFFKSFAKEAATFAFDHMENVPQYIANAMNAIKHLN